MRGYEIDQGNYGLAIPLGEKVTLTATHDKDGFINGFRSDDPRVKVTEKRNFRFELREVVDRGQRYLTPTLEEVGGSEEPLILAVARSFVSKLDQILNEAAKL